MSSAVLLPVSAMPTEEHRVAALLHLLQGAEETYRVDVHRVFEYPQDHVDHLVTVDALEFLVRPRASVSVADADTKLLEPAGFVEVRP